MPESSPSPRPAAGATDHDVVCIGNALVDVLAHTDEAFLEARGLTKGTMGLIDDATATALYADMGPAIEVSGGSAANTAAGIASFGGRAAFIGRVADDQLGEVFAHDLRSTGVHFATPPGPPGPPATGRCLVLVTADAQRTLNTSLGASADIGPADVDLDLIAASSVLYCEGYLWDAPDAKAAIALAMDTARAAGREVAFTLSDPFCVERHRTEFLDLVEHRIDLLFANEIEICALYDVATFEEAAEAVVGHVGTACLTRSEAGSVIVTAAGRVAVPAEPVDAVVDTTGAGDLFAAGYLVGHTRGLPVAECARLGAIAAAEVIAHVGARPQVPLASLV